MPTRNGSLPAAVVCVLVVLAPAGGEPLPQEDPAVAAARKRQEAVRTLVVEFRATEVIPRGSVSNIDEPWPDEDLIAQSDNRLVIDGKKIRFEDNHFYWFLPNRKLTQTRLVSLFDGSGTTQFYPQGTGAGGPPSALINVGQQDFKSPQFEPIAMTFRGLDPTLAIQLISALHPTGVNLDIDGSPCLEYAAGAADDGSIGVASRRYYLDPAADYIIRRVQFLGRNARLHQQDIHYRKDGTDGWVPVGWESFPVVSPNGERRRTTKVEVTRLQFNETQPASEFEIVFPPGTEVTDARDHKEYRVQPDGSLSGLGKWRAAEPPPPEVPWYRNKWVLIGGTVALATAVALTYFRMRKSRRTIDFVS